MLRRVGVVGDGILPEVLTKGRAEAHHVFVDKALARHGLRTTKIAELDDNADLRVKREQSRTREDIIDMRVAMDDVILVQ